MKNILPFVSFVGSYGLTMFIPSLFLNTPFFVFCSQFLDFQVGNVEWVSGGWGWGGGGGGGGDWERRLSFWNFPKKGDSDFSHKNGGVGKIGGWIKKEGYHLFSYLVTLSSVIFLWVFGVFVLCLFAPFLSVFICVSQEEPSLIAASNQQIYDFYKWIIFEKKRHCGK